MHGLVNLLRFRFIHPKNIDEILHSASRNPSRFVKPDFTSVTACSCGDRQRAGQCLRGLRDLLFHCGRGRGVLVDVNFPAGQPRS